MTTPPAVYIAGPYVFYRRGYTQLDAFRYATEARGFTVTLPNDTVLKLDHEDLRLNGDAIFENCAVSMDRSDTIICDLAFYRGFEPDGGSVYEIGMAYAKGARLYGFTRDLRDMVEKGPTTALVNGEVEDVEGNPYAYWDLPFCPSLVATTKLIEGDFYDALDALEQDYARERVAQGRGQGTKDEAAAAEVSAASNESSPRVYVAGPERYAKDAERSFTRLKELGRSLGLNVLTPLDDAKGVTRIESDDPYVQAGNDFARWEANLRSADMVVANLSDYHGREPNSDTAFECGMAFQLGIPMIGCMDDTRIMLERIAHRGPDDEYRDQAGSVVENFNYPLNIMFASSMPIYEGDLEDALRHAAEAMID